MPSRARHRLAALLLLGAAAACSSPVAPPPALGPASTAAAAQVATFEGRFDPATGKLTFTSLPAGAVEGPQARVAIAPWSDGSPGTGPKNTFELRTGAVAGLGTACPGPAASWEGEVTLTSFFDDRSFSDVAVELTELAPSGCEACGDTPSYGGMDGTRGLWSYGPIAAGGSATRTWRFAQSGSGAFTFRGRIVASLDPATAPANGATSFDWTPSMFMDPPHSFQDVATTRSHVVWNGSTFVDTKGVASFAQVIGGSPRASTPVAIAYPAQAHVGPWTSGADRYEASPTTAALDTSGDFTVCVKFKPGVNPGPLERKVLVAKGNPIGQPDGSYAATDLGWALTQQRGPLIGGGPQYGFFYRTGLDPSATDTFVFPGDNPERSAFDYTCGGRVGTGCVIAGEPAYTGPCIRVMAHGRDVHFDYKVTGTFPGAEALPLVIGSAATGLWPALDEGVYEVIIDARGATSEVMREIVDAAEGRRTFNGAAFAGNDLDALPVPGLDGLTYGFPLGSTAPVSPDGSGLLAAGRVLRFSKVLAGSPGAYCVGAEVTSPDWATALGGILGDENGILRLFIPASDHVATGFNGGVPAWGPDLRAQGWTASSRHVFKVCAATGSPVELWVDGAVASRGTAGPLFDPTSAASELYVGQGRNDVNAMAPLTGARIGRVFACPTAVAADCN